MPARCPLIPEADEIGHPVRHLLYGKRTSIYRIIFDIQEASEEGPRVRVLRIWHDTLVTIMLQRYYVARKPLTLWRDRRTGTVRGVGVEIG